MVDLIIPIYNEGNQILKLMKTFQEKLQINIKVYLCYDHSDDNVFDYKEELSKFNYPIIFTKNISTGPCLAVITGLKQSNSSCKIVYPADDFLNIELIQTMYQKFLEEDADIVVASRFIKGGSMIGCPILKSLLVRTASSTLYFLSSIPVRDASNGFRLFSSRLLEKVKIESKLGFAYSLELLVKCHRMKMNIKEVPAKWEERNVGKSNFKIFKWIKEYLKWYMYGMQTFWLQKKYPIDINEK